MNRTYTDCDTIMDTETIINIQSDGFDAKLTISYKTGPDLDKEYVYSGTRVCFHRLTKTLIHLYELGKYAQASLYEHAFKDLVSVWYSNTELYHLMDEYGVNDPIDLVDTLLKEGAYKTLRGAFKMN